MAHPTSEFTIVAENCARLLLRLVSRLVIVVSADQILTFDNFF